MTRPMPPVTADAPPAIPAAAFTPGPWVAVRQDFRRLDAPEPFYTVGPSEFTTIADVRAGSDDDDLPKQVEANAHLIAASPCLLAAAITAEKHFEFYADKHEAKGTYESIAKGKANRDLAAMCRRAIARALGAA